MAEEVQKIYKFSISKYCTILENTNLFSQLYHTLSIFLSFYFRYTFSQYRSMAEIKIFSLQHLSFQCLAQTSLRGSNVPSHLHDELKLYASVYEQKCELRVWIDLKEAVTLYSKYLHSDLHYEDEKYGYYAHDNNGISMYIPSDDLTTDSILILCSPKRKISLNDLTGMVQKVACFKDLSIIEHVHSQVSFEVVVEGKLIQQFKEFDGLNITEFWNSVWYTYHHIYNSSQIN